jgi:hypothetical protein
MKSRPVEKSVRRKRQRSSFRLTLYHFACYSRPVLNAVILCIKQARARPPPSTELPEQQKSQTGINIKAGWMDGWMDIRHSTHIVHLSVETNSIIQFI